MVPQIDDFHPMITVLAVAMVIIGLVGTFTNRR